MVFLYAGVGQRGRRGGSLRLPQLVDLPLLQRLAGQVEELVDLMRELFIPEQVDLKSKVDHHRQAARDVVDLPHGPIGQDDPLDAFVDGVHLDLTEMPRRQFGGDSLDPR